VSTLLDVFKSAPPIQEISDPEKVKTEYKYWRIRIMYSMFIGYAFYYFTRKSFTFAMPGLIQELGFDKAQLGILASIFSITYGLSKFGSGILSDKMNSRYFMAIGLMLTGIFNIFFSLSSSLMLFALFWGLNGWFQGFGWPPCARYLKHWYSHSERGSWWATWNVSQNVGSFLIPWIVGICLYFFGWRSAMYIPGVICLLGGLFLINRLRDTPQSLGLPSIEKFRNDYPAGVSKSDVDNERPMTTREMLKLILTNKYIWLLAIAYFFVYAVRMGINDWTALFLIETKDYSRIGANGAVSLFEIGGFFGSLCAGWSSDRIFGAKRGPVNVIFAIGMLVAITLFWYVPAGYPLFDTASVFAMGFCIYGPQMLIGVVAVELAPKQASSTASGFVCCCSYMGAAVAGYPLGFLLDKVGWGGFLVSMLACCFIAILLLLPMWGVTEGSGMKAKMKSKDKEPEPTTA
jgi:OPA family sugar phosphate sensor protein UhpC-like MFS transporter